MPLKFIKDSWKKRIVVRLSGDRQTVKGANRNREKLIKVSFFSDETGRYILDVGAF